MAQDHRKVRVFAQADTLVIAVYRATTEFPIEERYVLRAQIRRAAANGSTAEARYLSNVAHRLGFISAAVDNELGGRYIELTKGLQRLIVSLDDEP
jgi:hypothetical protein